MAAKERAKNAGYVANRGAPPPSPHYCLYLLVYGGEGPAHDDVVVARVNFRVQFRAPDQIDDPLLGCFDLHTLNEPNTRMTRTIIRSKLIGNKNKNKRLE